MSSPDFTAVAEVADLLNEARAGSPEALGRALMACRAYLLLVADRKLAPQLRCKADASDLVQETFLEAQRDFARFDGVATEDWLSWLCQILLHNVANTVRRYRHTEKRALDRELALVPGEGAALVAEMASPSAQAACHEETAALEVALSHLPEHYRRVLHLRYQEKQTFAQIGTTLSCSAEAARKLWARAVSRLQKMLESLQQSG